MTDTAIPIPDDLEAVMAPRVEAALEVFRRAWAPVIRDTEQGLREFGRVWSESMEASAQRWRVRNTMPTLTVRQTLVHGYVRYKEA